MYGIIIIGNNNIGIIIIGIILILVNFGVRVDNCKYVLWHIGNTNLSKCTKLVIML